MSVAIAGAPPRGFLIGTLGIMAQTFFWLLAGLIVSIVIEIIGMLYWWPEAGATRSLSLLQAELSYLGDEFPRSVLTTDPLAFALSVVRLAHEWLVIRTGLELLVDSLAGAAPAPIERVPAYLHELLSPTVPYLQASVTMTQVYAARLAVLLLATPVFVLAGMVGLVEGLVQRDLRRWGSGRESSFVYHHVRRLILPSLLASWAIYLALPFAFHPAFVVFPCALAFGLSVLTASRRFKKYL